MRSAFWKFWCNVIYCKSVYTKTDSTVICVLCMLGHVCLCNFLYDIANLDDILLC